MNPKSTPSMTAPTTRKMPRNHSTTFSGDTGKSPTKRPVWPFMANRKSLSFQRVCSIHTGSNACLISENDTSASTSAGSTWS